MMKIKNNFKLTPDIRAEIIVISRQLPKLHRKNTGGELMYRAATQIVKGSDLPHKVLINNKKTEPHPDKKYLQRGREPILINHEVNLIKVYMQKGQPGIDDYVKTINNFLKEK